MWWSGSRCGGEHGEWRLQGQRRWSAKASGTGDFGRAHARRLEPRVRTQAAGGRSFRAPEGGPEHLAGFCGGGWASHMGYGELRRGRPNGRAGSTLRRGPRVHRASGAAQTAASAPPARTRWQAGHTRWEPGHSQWQPGHVRLQPPWHGAAAWAHEVAATPAWGWVGAGGKLQLERHSPWRRAGSCYLLLTTNNEPRVPRAHLLLTVAPRGLLLCCLLLTTNHVYHVLKYCSPWRRASGCAFRAPAACAL